MKNKYQFNFPISLNNKKKKLIDCYVILYTIDVIYVLKEIQIRYDKYTKKEIKKIIFNCLNEVLDNLNKDSNLLYKINNLNKKQVVYAFTKECVKLHKNFSKTTKHLF